MTDASCAVPDCAEDGPFTRGWCRGHYMRWYKTGDVQAHKPLKSRARANSVTQCSVPGCPQGGPYSNGLCLTHWGRKRKTGDVQADKPIRKKLPTGVRENCKFDDCPQNAAARGWCHTHYKRWQVHGDPAVVIDPASRPRPKPVERTCTVDLCPHPADGLKWCKTHGRRYRVTGDVHADVPIGQMKRIRKTCNERGCGDPAHGDGLCSKHYWIVKRREVKNDPERWAVKQKYHREWHAAWRKANPGRMRALRKAWVAANRDVVRLHSSRKRVMRMNAPAIPYTRQQLAARMAYWGNRCWMCRGPFEDVDHVKPLAKGGWDALMNLRPSCGSCNGSKGARWPFPVAVTA